MAGSNCIGPSAPAPLEPEWTPGRSEVPFPDSTVPMAASTVQGRPGQVAAASWYSASIAAGMPPVAVTRRSPCPPRRGARHRPPRSPRPSRWPPGRVRPHRLREGGERSSTEERSDAARHRAQGRHTWAMKSTMQDAPLLISDILRHGPAAARRQHGHHRRGRGPPYGHLRRGGGPGRETGRGPARDWASATATGWARSAGTTRVIWRPTWPFPAWGRCCTP